MTLLRCAPLLLVILLASAYLGPTLGAAEPVRVKVRTAEIIKDVRHGPLGIGMEPFVEDPASMAASLRALGVRHLRWGDQMHTFWAPPPYERPQRVVALRGAIWPSNDRSWVEEDGVTVRSSLVTDFDEFMNIALAVDARPLLITTYNSMYMQPHDGVTVPDRETYWQAMEGWVRYANRTRGHGIRYWELGNEVWNTLESGGTRITPGSVRDDLREIVPRLKAIDPEIRILVSGKEHEFRVLVEAAQHIDYLNFSWYLWRSGGYEGFLASDRMLENSGSFKAAVAALETLPEQERNRIGLIITEFSALDWADKDQNGWANTNDLGHALCAFQMAGEALSHPRVHLANFWTTRFKWPYSSRTSDDAASSNAVRNDGQLTATGKAIAIWGNHMLDAFVATTSSAAPVRTWATRSLSDGRLRIFLLNKALESTSVSLALDAMVSVVALHQLTGTSITDPAPIWSAQPAPTSLDSLTVPATSVTMLEFRMP